MKKILLIILTIPLSLCARIEVAESDSISKKQLMSKIKSTPNLIIKAYDADEETGSVLDEEYKDVPNVTLYKVAYHKLGSKTTAENRKDNWAATWFGDGYDDLDTVYQVYRNGNKRTTIYAKKIKNPTTFKTRVNHALFAA